MPPTQTSLVWVVVGVEPVLALTLLPEAPAKTSAGLVAVKPLYSITTAEANSDEARFTVTVVPALPTLGAHQISTVEPPLAVLVPCEARVQVTPLCVTLVTWLPAFPRVEITATSAFPLVGTGTVTLNDVAAADPTEPTDVLTRDTFTVEAVG